jgi:hypothetical protein
MRGSRIIGYRMTRFGNWIQTCDVSGDLDDSNEKKVVIGLTAKTSKVKGRSSSGAEVRNAYPLEFQAEWVEWWKSMNHESVWERFRCYCMRTASRLGDFAGGKSNRAKGGGARFRAREQLFCRRLPRSPIRQQAFLRFLVACCWAWIGWAGLAGCWLA